jgi:hypothetical protein
MHLLNILKKSKINYEIVHHNLQQLIDTQKKQSEKNKKLHRSFDYDTSYHTLAEIEEQFDVISKLPEHYDKVKYFSIGNTYEGRQIPALTITNPGKY